MKRILTAEVLVSTYFDLISNHQLRLMTLILVLSWTHAILWQDKVTAFVCAAQQGFMEIVKHLLDVMRDQVKVPFSFKFPAKS